MFDELTNNKKIQLKFDWIRLFALNQNKFTFHQNATSNFLCRIWIDSFGRHWLCTITIGLKRLVQSRLPWVHCYYRRRTFSTVIQNLQKSDWKCRSHHAFQNSRLNLNWRFLIFFNLITVDTPSVSWCYTQYDGQAGYATCSSASECSTNMACYNSCGVFG